MIKLEEIMNSPVCYGCGACVSTCPSEAICMRTDKKGSAAQRYLKVNVPDAISATGHVRLSKPTETLFLAQVRVPPKRYCQ